jgi:hypothetical protein
MGRFLSLAGLEHGRTIPLAGLRRNPNYSASEVARRRLIETVEGRIWRKRPEEPDDD